MSVGEILNAARAAGIEFRVVGNDLLLEAPKPPDPEVFEALSRHKAEILTVLRQTESAWSREDWRVFFDEHAGIAEHDYGLPRPEAEGRAFASCVAEWLNRNPAPSRAGHCAWCAEREGRSARVLPFGTELGTHAWLHSDCWPQWRKYRENKAIEALRLMSVI